MDTVLGLSMTPTTVGLVLVEGQRADGHIIDHDALEVHTDGGAATARAAEQVAAAVFRAQAIEAGHRLHSIGVTWSSDASAEASLLLESLTESGFDNVVPIRLPEASEALARGIGQVIGYDKTAVCVVEHDEAFVLVVDTRDGAMQTASSQVVDDEDLIRWLTGIFESDDLQPEALFVVGSIGDLDALTARLEETLPMPVFAPAEAELALARGAALAAAKNPEFGYTGAGEERGYDNPGRRWQLSYTGVLTTLVAGVLTFVVSLSIAVGMRLAPDRESELAENRQMANTSQTPAIKQAVVPPVPPPTAQVQAPPPAVQPPVPDTPPAATIETESPVVFPAAEPELSLPEEPAAVLPAAPPVAPPPAVAPVPPAPVAVPPVIPAAPQPLAPQPVPQAPEDRPGILTRIKDRLPLINRIGDDEPAQQVPPPAPFVPPGGQVPPP